MQVMQVFRDMEDKIKKIITANIDDAECSFQGDSCNLRVVITSNTFSGMSLLDQHKTVMRLLEDKFQSGELHALSLETKTF